MSPWAHTMLFFYFSSCTVFSVFAIIQTLQKQMFILVYMQQNNNWYQLKTQGISSFQNMHQLRKRKKVFVILELLMHFLTSTAYLNLYMRSLQLRSVCIAYIGIFNTCLVNKVIKWMFMQSFMTKKDIFFRKHKIRS